MSKIGGDVGKHYIETPERAWRTCSCVCRCRAAPPAPGSGLLRIQTCPWPPGPVVAGAEGAGDDGDVVADGEDSPRLVGAPEEEEGGWAGDAGSNLVEHRAADACRRYAAVLVDHLARTQAAKVVHRLLALATQAKVAGLARLLGLLTLVVRK